MDDLSLAEVADLKDKLRMRTILEKLVNFHESIVSTKRGLKSSRNSMN